MTPRKRNMLEAFQDGRDLPEPAAEYGSSARARAAGPLAEELPGLRGPAPRPEGTASSSPGAPRSPGDAMPRLVPAALAVLLVGFWLGRLSTGWWASTEAPQAAQDLTFETRVSDGPAPTSRPAPQREPSAGQVAHEAASAAATEGYTPDDLAFLDRVNKVTLRAYIADASPAGQRLALESYRHLRANGIPAVAPFVAGDLTLICVGAAPSVRDPELARLREVLLTLGGPPPRSEQTPYASAFLINIDDVVVRD